MSSGVKLYSIYGGTEFGAPTHPFPSKTDRDVMDWAWQRFSDRANVRWIAQGDGTYECQLLVHLLGALNEIIHSYRISYEFLVIGDALFVLGEPPGRQGLFNI